MPLWFSRAKRDLEGLGAGEVIFSSSGTGVALTAGAVAKVHYSDGLTVFVVAEERP